MSYEGSMRGSGIYEESHAMELTCRGLIEYQSGAEVDCTFDGEVDVHFDDWGVGSWTCPTCAGVFEYEVPEIGE